MAPSKKQFYLLDTYNVITLEKDSKLWLGRVVQDYAKPIQGYAPTKKDAPIHPHSGPSEILDFSKLLDSTKSTAVRAKLMNFFSGKVEGIDTVSKNVSAKKVWRYVLKDVDGVFKKAIVDEEVAGRLHDWLSLFGRQAYIITGFLVAEEVKFEDSDNTVRKGTLDADPGAAVAAAFGALGLEGVSASGGFDVSHEKKGDMKATVAKSIFAVEYRSLRKRFLAKEGKDVGLGFGPQGPAAFGGEEEGERVGEMTTTGFELDGDTVKDMLEDLGADGVELEEYGDFSIVIGGDGGEDDDKEEEEEGEEGERLPEYEGSI
jgi:hypothetical protein